MAVTVVDAGVVIAALDLNDLHHVAVSQRLRELRNEREPVLILPTSAYAEVLVHPARVGAVQLANAQEFGRRYFRLEPISPAIAEAAASLRAHHKALRLPDALVIAAAVVLGAHRLLTTDSKWKRYASMAEVVS